MRRTGKKVSGVLDGPKDKLKLVSNLSVEVLLVLGVEERLPV